ncbi:hypothetical protein ACGFZG_17500 [Streptomyces antibioticus]|uniref:hypothetical protein n=1 Tax=Streptomyces antibioticus TaxID=1890 RepID=UPI0036FD45AD
MRRSRSILVGAAAALTFSGIPLFVSTAQADPSCVVSTTGSTSGKSFTVKVTSNPCGRKARAYLGCINPDTFYRTTKYGAALSGVGTSKATCHPDDKIEKRGHQVYVPGQGWTTYLR